MKQIFEGLFVGNQNDIPLPEMATVHAAKDPYHREAVGYKGALANDHPNYLMLKKPDDLYLNMIDPKFALLPEWTNPMFEAAILFIAEAIQDDKQILVRCNKGQSRSPSIVLAYMARSGMISNESYELAKAEFSTDYYPEYLPGEGIQLYLARNWDFIIKK